MRILGVIPARYASTRFPGKPLVEIDGISMVMRTFLQAQKANLLSDVVVATDDQRIFDHVVSQGGKVVMTADAHPTGTDRLIEVADLHPDFDGYINIQGDEPFIEPAQIDQVGAALGSENAVRVSTLVKKIEDLSQIYNPNVVKATRMQNGKAIAFSRSPIPFFRQASFEWGIITPEMEAWHSEHGYFRHIGIYGFIRVALAQIRNLNQSALEKAESLEQLRWLEAGIPIYTQITTFESIGIDSPEDLERILRK